MKPEANPLLRAHTSIPFEEIRPLHIRSAVKFHISQGKALLKKILTDPMLTPEEILMKLEELREPLEYVVRVGEHLEAVVANPRLRLANETALRLTSRFESTFKTSPALLRLLERLEELEGDLDPFKQRYRRRLVEELRREGAGLSRRDRLRLKEINEALLLKTTQFARNAQDATQAFSYRAEDPEEVQGIPATILSICVQAAQRRGERGWLFTLAPPIYLSVMRHARNRTLRERLYRASVTRATAPPFDNRHLLSEILDLRKKKAKILGYPSFADFVLEPRMARNSERALDFLYDLTRRAHDRFLEETEELREFFAHHSGEDPGELKPWDLLFYEERLREERFSLSEEMLRPYFPLSRVLEGVMRLAEILYGLKFEEILKGDPLFPSCWHPQVRYFRAYDEEGYLRGGFYLDLHPREGKREGAWMNGLVVGGPLPLGGFHPHTAVICANLTPPHESEPSLLSFTEVQTLFHEFGHLLHHLLSDVPIRFLGGTRVAWDFVELPSQLMESWCWEEKAVPFFSSHWQTGEPLPPETIRTLRKMRGFRAASELMRQCSYGILDLRIHRDYDPQKDGDPVSFSRHLLNRYAPVPLPSDYALVASFHHLFADPVGYAAGYYSYQWSEVLAADLFRRFEREGVLNPNLGRELRRTLLSRGDSQDPEVLFRNFMGRDPDPGALFERLFSS